MTYPAIDPHGAVVLITGGGRGIGLATAELFARHGAIVCVADLDGAAATEAAQSIGPQAFPYTADVSSAGSFSDCVRAVLDSFGRIDVLVNNAGVMPLGDFLAEPEATSRTTIDVNLWGPVHGMRLVLPHMISRRRGHIVNVASMAGKIPIPGMAVYNASKFAAVGLSAAVRAEFAPTGVSVSTVLPSAVRTRLSSGVPLGRGLPTVSPSTVATAIFRTLATRRAEVPVPRYLAAWDLLNALTPEPLMRSARRLIGDRRALTSVDPTARAAYEQSIADQAAG
ncbi:SDR family oxidoreductase [Kutzneria chonburiensis]|uniref:SDR family oxidoreductase n=1 Tax=Kutzneria chonburiensis TaxID=1483604 RepID=A0ABV6N0G6_9PSEU|nr:SDR family oxidoreductase [Kutzneria chonburiensis]